METTMKMIELENPQNLFKNRNFMLLFIGKLVSQLGDAIYTLAITWFILNLTGTGVLMSLYLAIGMVTLIIMGPIGGVLADRWDRRRVIYGMDLIRGIAVAIAGVFFYLQVATTILLVALFSVTIIINVCSALFNPASMAVTPLIVREEQLTKANSLNSIVNSGANFVGLILGGILYAVIGVEGIFILKAASYILSGVSEMFITLPQGDKIKTDTEANENNQTKGWTELIEQMKEGYLYIKKERWIYVLIWAGFFINVALAPMLTIFVPYIFNQIIKTEPIQLSYVQSALGVGMILGAIFIGALPQREKVGKFLKVVVTLVLIPLIGLAILFHLTQSAYYTNQVLINGFIIGFLIIGVLMAMINIPINVLFQRKVPNELMGRVDAVLGTLMMAGMPIGMVVGGLLADFISMQALLIGTAGIFMMITVGILLNEDTELI
ncbi:Predicted arabinose efflux permease, MFS family [Alkaliphilus peptidifermentans DSM 18978]|uniref:Predicted arabinose efflux permease, MFS family n=2 Tax=Alkaliphilus TaxID=114627 RepID=A0A1G5HB07_9FIRM|nr:Predicted arabinose efflux permease, MFS family [Alkaliphilus peptidifermentans DSM 18978]